MERKEYVPSKVENALVKTAEGIKFYVKGSLKTFYSDEVAKNYLLKEFGETAVKDFNKYGYFNWITL